MSALGVLVSASSRQRRPGRRTAAWIIAVAGPVLITLGTVPFRSAFGLADVLFTALLFVVAVSVIGGARPALAAVFMGLLPAAFVFVRPLGGRALKPGDGVALVTFVLVAAALALVLDPFVFIAEERGVLLALEAALRRVATLVARGASPEEVFASVVEEVGRVLPVDFADMGRYEPGGRITFVAAWGGGGRDSPVGTRWTLEGKNLSTIVFKTGRHARLDCYHDATGPLGARARERSFRSAVGTPIIVEGRLWGVVIAGSTLEHPLPADTEARLADFTELLATAVANAESRAALSASRARVVAAADETRRRIERDLHDGAQQQLVTLGLELNAAQAAVPRELGEVHRDLSRVAAGLASLQNELREIARGIHPAILTEGGLGPALKTLGRRSPIPVTCDVRVSARLPEPVEVAAYYVVSEALANAAKHARASFVQVDVEEAERTLRLSVRDDGAGGATLVQGSGLAGLKDRVEALGGTISVQSPLGAGTLVYTELPLTD